MEAADITAVFFAMEEVHTALLFGPEAIVPGRRCAITSLGATFDRAQVLEDLKTLFPSHLQIIGGNMLRMTPFLLKVVLWRKWRLPLLSKLGERLATCLETLMRSLTYLKFSFLLL